MLRSQLEFETSKMGSAGVALVLEPMGTVTELFGSELRSPDCPQQDMQCALSVSDARQRGFANPAGIREAPDGQSPQSQLGSALLRVGAARVP